MLRKRKRRASEDNAASPRATRQGCVLVDNEERDSMVPGSAIRSPGTPRAPKTPKTPATERRSTRKKNIVAASQDLTMSTRSRKTIPSKSQRDSDAENAVDPPKPKSKRAASIRRVTESAATEETHSTRSRAKREAQDTAENSSDVENDGKSSIPTEYRPTRKKRILGTADNTIDIPKATRSQAAKLIVTESLENVANNPAKRLKQSKTSTIEPVIETPIKKLRSLMQSSTDTITPESSPIPVNLTPQRSFKTPKKSPLNISSPKTHSQSPLRLSKTSRKLTVLTESPTASANSSVSMFTRSPVESANKTECSPVIISKVESTMEIDSESPPTFISVATMQLRTSREKRLDNTTLVSPSAHGNAVSTPPNTVGSSPPNPENPKRVRSTMKKKNSSITSLGTPLRPISVATESPADVSAVFIPKKVNVLLEPSGSSLASTPRGKIRRSLHLTPDFTKFSGVSTSSPIPTTQKTEIILPSVFRRDEGPKDKSLELVDGNGFVDVSGNSSTQKEKNGTYEISKSDDDANEDKTESRDATYELAEPKTPNLRQMSRKRSLSHVETSHCTPEAKKRCRVRFATPKQEEWVEIPAGTPELDRKSLPSVKTPAKQKLEARLTIGSSSSRRRSRSVTKIEDKTPSTRCRAKRRSNSASALPQRTPQLSQNIQSSVNRLSRPRQAVASESKSEAKVPVPRKIPNFAQIHQKKFEKMESLVDAKKRVAKRHEELNTPPQKRAAPCSSAIPETTEPERARLSPSEPGKSEYTRFGFKVRKDEARQVIARKTTAPSSNKNRKVSNRSMLKDVRTNRRFELLMKYRNAGDKK